MNTDSRRHGQRFLWTDEPSSPFVRFQRVSSRQFVVWISAGTDLDIDDLDRALSHCPGPNGVVRSFIEFAGYELAPAEDELLTRYRAGDTGPAFWADVEAAGLLYEPPGKASSDQRPKRVAVPIPMSTAGPFVALTKALTRTSSEDWAPVEGELARESRHTFADFTVRLAAQPSVETVANWFPGSQVKADDDMLETLCRYGGQRACLTAQACTQLAARRPGVAIGFDQILQELAYKRPAGRVDSRAHRQAAKREAYAHIVLGQWAAAVGTIKRTVDGRSAGYEAWSLYAVDHVTFEADGTPAAITFLPVGLSRLIAENPAFLEYLGNVRDVLALPNTTPGRWAAAILYALRLHWRLNVRRAKLHANTGGQRQALEFAPIARRRLFGVMNPDPPTPEDLLTGPDARRAIRYFEEAIGILQGRRDRSDDPTIHVSYWRGLPTSKMRRGLEPWELAAPGSKPRLAQWRDAWLDQRLDVRPGGADLAELLQLRERVNAARRGLHRGNESGGGVWRQGRVQSEA